MKNFIMLSFLLLSLAASAQTDSMFAKGVSDSKEFYKPYNAITGGALSALLGGPVIGAIPTALIAFTPPKEKNLNLPYPDLALNHSYKLGYLKQAKNRKLFFTLLGFDIIAVPTAIVLIALSLQ